MAGSGRLKLPVVLVPVFGNRIRLPYTVDFTALPDGTLPAQWLANPAWSVANGVVVGTPTLGVEDLANGDMEAGDPPTNWTAGSSGVLAGAADERTGGSGEQSLSIVNGAASAGRATQTLDNLIGAWIHLAGWGRQVINASPILRIYDGGTLLGSFTASGSTSWASGFVVVRLKANGCHVRLSTSTAVANDESYFDDISAKPLAPATLLARLRQRARQALIIKAAWSIIAGAQCGLIGWWDGVSPLQNCLLAYHNRTNAILGKFIGATWTELVNASAAYAAGRVLEIRRTAGSNVFGLYYNNVQIGVDQTLDPVTDAAIISNPYHGLFSTYVGNTCSSFTVS